MYTENSKNSLGLKAADKTNQQINYRYLLIRRYLDIFTVIVSLPLIVPIFFILSVILAFKFKGRIFYTQTRAGFMNKPFQIIKFRTMIDCPLDENKYIVHSNELVTKFGNFLRIHRLDEIPQLLNVLKGEMSIIGPRPEAVSHYEFFAEKIESYSLRKIVPQGITGLAQINYPPTVTVEGAREKLKYDLKYINNLSLLSDIKIIYGTFIQMFTGNNSI
jgi:lipopolysaccharide/colanic/teichoic acid biosynthesis glycosyltransferase